jgi:hypothetical protein
MPIAAAGEFADQRPLGARRSRAALRRCRLGCNPERARRGTCKQCSPAQPVVGWMIVSMHGALLLPLIDHVWRPIT